MADGYGVVSRTRICSRSVASSPRLDREAQPYMGTVSIAGSRSGRAVGSWAGSSSFRFFLRGCRRRFVLGELQLHRIGIVQVHDHLSAVGQLAEQQLVGQRLADHVLDQALHRACAHQRVEALLGQLLAQRVAEGDLDLLLLQLAFQLHLLRRWVERHVALRLAACRMACS